MRRLGGGEGEGEGTVRTLTLSDARNTSVDSARPLTVSPSMICPMASSTSARVLPNTFLNPGRDDAFSNVGLYASGVWV